MGHRNKETANGQVSVLIYFLVGREKNETLQNHGLTSVERHLQRALVHPAQWDQLMQGFAQSKSCPAGSVSLHQLIGTLWLQGTEGRPWRSAELFLSHLLAQNCPGRHRPAGILSYMA